MAASVALSLLAGLLSAAPVLGITGTGPSVALSTFTADPNGTTGAFHVPATNVPAAAFQPATSTSGSSVEALSFFHSSFFHSSFFHSSFFHSSFFHSSFFHSGLTDTSFFHSSFFHSSFFHSALDATLLSDIPLTYPAECGTAGHPDCTGWPGLLALSAALAGQPIQTVTLQQVLDDLQAGDALRNLPTGNIDLTRTPLGDLPFAALALGGIPLKHLPLVGGVPGTTAMEQWCNVLLSPAIGINCATQLGIQPSDPDQPDPATGVINSDHVSVVTLMLLGVGIENLPLDSIALATLGTDGRPLVDLSGSPLGDALLAEMNLDSSSLGAVLLHDMAVGNTNIGGRQLGSITRLASVPLGQTTLDSITLSQPGIGDVPLAAINLAAVPLGPVGGPGPATLADVPLAASQLRGIQFGDAVTVGAAPLSRFTIPGTSVGALPLGQLRLSPLAGIGSITFGDIPSALLPGIVDCTNTGIDCTVAATTLAFASEQHALMGTVGDLAGQGIAVFDGMALADLVVGFPDGTHPAGTLALSQLVEIVRSGDASAITLGAVAGALPTGAVPPAKLQDMVAHSTGPSGVASVTLTQLLAASNGNGTTLGQLLGALDDTSAVTVADLLKGLDHQAVVLGDLLVGILAVSPDDLPFEHLDLSGVTLPPLADHAVSPSITYTATMDVVEGGAGPQDVGLDVIIPPGFVYEPLSAVLDGHTALGDPQVGAAPSPHQVDPMLSWTAMGLADGAHSVSFHLWASNVEGPGAAVASVHLLNATAASAISATTAVVDASSSNPANPFPMVGGDLYLGHLSASRTVAYFQIDVPVTGKRLSISLSNLPADYDLTMYAPTDAPHLRGAPERTITAVDDGQLSLAPLSQSLAPETLQDVPLLPGRDPYAVSANREKHDERIDTGLLSPGPYIVQVSAFNGAADGVNPYALRARLIDDPVATCPGTHVFADPTAVAPALPAPPAGDFDTVMLIDPGRLAKTWGPAGATTVMGSLAGFVAARPASVVDVEGLNGVAADYSAWDSDPCSVDAANKIVTDIGAGIDAMTAAHPSIRYIVLVGADNLIPMARVRDATVIANERTFQQAFPGAANELTASLAGGYLLTDDPYGTSHPAATRGRDIFVPDLAVGRLVESPGQIAKSLDDFVHNNGRLPSSATALATGYDFMRDGATAVAQGLGAGGRRGVDSSLISDTWTKSDLAGHLLPSTGAPNIASINGHFDQAGMLPATGGVSNTFTTADVPLPADGSPPPLQGRLLFSMGCHAGFNVPDQIGVVGSTADWADTFAQQGALWVANTGYGYGDDKTVALSERLMALFSSQLDSAGSIGNAYVSAKRAYAAGLAVASPYDEKTMMEATFFGLPMYALPAPTGTGTVTTPPLTTPTAPAANDGPIGGTGPGTVWSAPIKKSVADGTSSPGPGRFDFVADGPNTPLDGHYEIDGQTVAVQQRPIQPRVELEVSPTAVAGVPAGYVAKGALITGLVSRDYAGFKPDYFRPALDNSGNESSQDVGEAAFPAGMQTLTTYRSAGGGTVQHLVLVPAQFRPTPGLDVPGRGVERLFTDVEGKVFYGPDSGDNVPPTIFRWSASVSDALLQVTAHVEDLADARHQFDGVSVVTVLYSLSTAPGAWVSLPLTRGANPGDWTATVAVPANARADAILQAVRTNGAVATSTLKAAFFNASRFSATGPFRFRFSDGARGANGWWRTGPTVTVVPPLGDTSIQPIEYKIDGAADFTPYTGPFAVTADGIHTITVHQDRYDDSQVQVLVDSLAPVPNVTFPAGGPEKNNNNWFAAQPVEADIAPTDPNDTGSGVDTVTYSASGATVIPTTTVNEPPVGSTPISALVTTDGKTVFTVAATDRAGNASAPQDFPVKLDTVAADVTITRQETQHNAWHNAASSPVHLTISATDPAPTGPGGRLPSGVASITYSVGTQRAVTVNGVLDGDGNGPATLATDLTISAEGINRLVVDVVDAAGNLDEQVRDVKIDTAAPASAASDAGVNLDGWNNPTTTPAIITLSAHDVPGVLGLPSDQLSGVDVITFSKDGAETAGPAVYSSPFGVAAEGVTTVTYHATDVAGNDELDQSLTVKVDLHAPNITCTPGTVDTLWHADDQSFSCTAADPALADGNAGSGLAHTGVGGDAAFILKTSVPSNTQTPTASTNSRIVCDRAGNCTAAKLFTPVKVDKLAPFITASVPPTSTSPPVPVGTPTSMPTYLLGQPEAVRYSCSDGDPGAGSGVATCSAVEQLPDGSSVARANAGSIDTTQVGVHSVKVTTTDNVGNTRDTTLQYRVVYNVCLQYDPTKASTLGSTIAIKVRLCTYSGVNVSSGSLTLRAYQVDGKTSLLSPNFAGSSNLGYFFRYDPTTSTYIYNLKTSKQFQKDNVMTFAVNGPNGGTGGDPVTPATLPSGYDTKLLYLAPFKLK